MSYPLVAASLSLFVAVSLSVPDTVAQPGQSSPQRGAPGSFGDNTIGSATISGTIRTPDGHGIGNASIEARDIGRGNRIYTAYSDSSGSFALYNIAPGTYEITATSGANEAQDRVEVNALPGGATVDLRLQNRSAGVPITAGNSTVSVAQYTIPAKARSLFEKAVQLKEHGKPGDSLKKVNAALAVCPKFAEALTLRGVLQQNAGKTTEAAADFQQAIQDDPNYPFAYLAMAALLNSSGRYNESLPILAEAERLAPDVWQTYFELSRANIEKGDFTTALLNLDRASELQGGPDKEYAKLHLVRGYALIGAGQLPAAVHELETFLARQPTGDAADHARKVLDQLRAENVSADR